MLRNLLQLRHDGLVLTRDLEFSADRELLRRRKHSGELIAVARGAYLAADVWNSLTPDERYRARIHAAVAIAPDVPVVAAISAGAVWRLPVIDDWPREVHSLISPAGGGRTGATLVRHTSSRPFDTVTIDGLWVTPLARTVVDVAARADFAQGVAMMDAALRRTTHPEPDMPRTALTRDDLIAEAALVPLRHGAARAMQCALFADGRAQRAGESLSRVSMHTAGVPAPILQAELRGASGRIYQVDHFWPSGEHWPHGAQSASHRQAPVRGSGLTAADLPGLIGEFDGKIKYFDAKFRGGRTAEQVAYDEKVREDDLRAAGHGFCRWDWHTSRAPHRVATVLRNSGLCW